jgi:hypothetical protein
MQNRVQWTTVSDSYISPLFLPRSRIRILAAAADGKDILWTPFGQQQKNNSAFSSSAQTMAFFWIKLRRKKCQNYRREVFQGNPKLNSF